MKALISAIAFLALGAASALAGQVTGYYRSNGTYVAPHYRSDPDSTVMDNYSYRGNSDPYTGNVGTNRYTHDLTSPFFNGTPYGNGHFGHAYGDDGE